MKQPNEDNNYITVRFSDLKEFLEELTPRDLNLGIDSIDNVIRVTKMFTRSDEFPIQGVSVIAAMLRHVPPTIQCIKLVRPCGQLMGFRGEIPHDDKVMNSADRLQNEIEQFAKKWNLEVRAGLFE